MLTLEEIKERLIHCPFCGNDMTNNSDKLYDIFLQCPKYLTHKIHTDTIFYNYIEVRPASHIIIIYWGKDGIIQDYEKDEMSFYKDEKWQYFPFDTADIFPLACMDDIKKLMERAEVLSLYA